MIQLVLYDWSQHGKLGMRCKFPQSTYGWTCRKLHYELTWSCWAIWGNLRLLSSWQAARGLDRKEVDEVWFEIDGTTVAADVAVMKDSEYRRYICRMHTVESCWRRAGLRVWDSVIFFADFAPILRSYPKTLRTEAGLQKQYCASIQKVVQMSPCRCSLLMKMSLLFFYFFSYFVSLT